MRWLPVVVVKRSTLEAIRAELAELRNLIIERFTIMADSLAALTDAVAETETAEQSAIVLIQGLIAELQAAQAANNQEAVTALIRRLHENATALAAAVATNPGTPTPAPAPAPATPATPSSPPST